MDFPLPPHYSPDPSPGMWAHTLTVETSATAYIPIRSALPISFPSPCQSLHSSHTGLFLSLRHTSSFPSQGLRACYSFCFQNLSLLLPSHYWDLNKIINVLFPLPLQALSITFSFFIFYLLSSNTSRKLFYWFVSLTAFCLFPPMWM